MSKILIKEGEMFKSVGYRIILLFGTFRVQRKGILGYKQVFESSYLSQCMAHMNILIKRDKKIGEILLSSLSIIVISFVSYIFYVLLSGF